MWAGHKDICPYKIQQNYEFSNQRRSSEDTSLPSFFFHIHAVSAVPLHKGWRWAMWERNVVATVRLDSRPVHVRNTACPIKMSRAWIFGNSSLPFRAPLISSQVVFFCCFFCLDGEFAAFMFYEKKTKHQGAIEALQHLGCPAVIWPPECRCNAFPPHLNNLTIIL